LFNSIFKNNFCIIQRSEENEIVHLKIAIIGQSLVGKSALTYRFMNDKFPEIHDTTIEDQYTINTNINGTECNVEILDTAGQEDYQSMLDSWITFADGYILVFSIDDIASYNIVQERLDKICKLKFHQDSKKSPSIVVIGNKSDLNTTRNVKYEEANKYCHDEGVDYIECSALTKHNVKEAFVKLFEKMIFNKKVVSETDKKEVESKKCFCF
jgi:small GTP-binding protein